jgi:hypothetical protein
MKRILEEIPVCCKTGKIAEERKVGRGAMAPVGAAVVAR